MGANIVEFVYEDARRAINEVFYTEVVFADDLNAYRIFLVQLRNWKLLQV